MLSLPHDLGARLQAHAEQSDLRDNGWLHRDPFQMHPAAVLVPLVWEKDQWHLLFTRRANGLQDHSGQVSFPGGAWEERDGDLERTALREAWEEVGINPASVAVLGKMARFDMVSHFQVTPVVGVVAWPFELKINASEVARAFMCRLIGLLTIGITRSNRASLKTKPSTFHTTAITMARSSGVRLRK